MLLYNNRSFWRIVLTGYGSVFFRLDNLIFGTLLSLVAAGVQYLINTQNPYAPDLPHHYGMHALGVVVGFAVVFRTNLGWTRYWEAVTQLHMMYSKWADAYSQLYAFASSSIETGEQKGTEDGFAKAARVQQLLEVAGQHFSVMSALASDRLAHGDTQRMEKRAELVEWSRQIALRRVLRYEDLTEARKLPAFKTKASRKSMSPALYDATNVWKGITYSVTQVPSEEERDMLERSSDRVNVVMYWIIHLLARCSKDLDIAPPIQSRMYQELSNGMLGFSQALKIADVPFPFPYAQLLTVILFAYACFIPFYVSIFSDSLIVSPVMTFLLFQGIWGINEVAKELENPFGADVNDISLADFHSRFMDLMCEVSESNSISIKRPITGSSKKQQTAEATDAKVDKEPKATPKEPAPSATPTAAATVAAPLTQQQPPAVAQVVALPPPPPFQPLAATLANLQVELCQATEALTEASPTPSIAECKVQGVPVATAGVKDWAVTPTLEAVATLQGHPDSAARLPKVPDASAFPSYAEMEPTGLSLGGPGRVTEVLNVHLAKMAACMEEHLGRISAELEAISVRSPSMTHAGMVAVAPLAERVTL